MRSVAIATLAVLSSGCALDTEGLLTSNDAGTAGGSGWGGGSGGGSAGSAGAGGTAAGGAGGAGGGQPGPENCLDGIDNDDNGVADCADPACMPAHTCVPAPPAGFTGYAFTRGDAFGAQPGPACANGTSPTRYFSEPAGDLVCEACGCGALTGGACGNAPLACATSSASCNSPANLTQTNGDCHNGDWQATSLSCKLGAPALLAEGSCPATGGGSQASDPFAGIVDVCRATSSSAGCANGERCVARETGDYSGYVCVEQSGDVPCPDGWGVRVLAYEGANDDRACAPCVCTPQGSLCVGAEYTFWDGLFCLGSNSSVSNDQCKDMSGYTDAGTWSFRRTKTANLVGACTPSGGQPTGNVNPQTPRTFCCRN